MEFTMEAKENNDPKNTKEPIGLILNSQDEVTEIMGNPPTWTMRWGIILIGIITFSGLTISAFISYPDIIEAPVYLTTENPPLEIFSKKEGKIKQLLVRDQQYVKANTLLATIENPADYQGVMRMKDFVKEVENKIGYWHQFSHLKIPSGLELGLLNNTFSELVQVTRDLQYYLKQQTVFAQMTAMDREIEQIKKLNSSLEKQEGMYEKELNLIRKNFERNILLFADNSISEMTLEKLENEYRSSQRAHENMRSGIINNEIRIEQINVERKTIEASRLNEISEKSLHLEQLIDRIKTAITEWQYNYLIFSPQAGVVQFDEYRQVNQFVPSSTIIFTVFADSTKQNTIIARSELPMTGSGKVFPGAKVNIRLTGFPYREYGSLTTEVSKIASLPIILKSDEPGYEMEMILPETLMTNYKNFIPFKHNMTGTARIITKDRSFFSRVFEQFLSAIKN